jgi:hypothetical protein
VRERHDRAILSVSFVYDLTIASCSATREQGGQRHARRNREDPAAAAAGSACDAQGADVAGAPPAHGRTPRGSLAPPPGRAVPVGKFGRMFPRITTALEVDDGRLEALAAAMKDTPETSSHDNEDIPAGYTYLGQFIDHDITFDTTPISERVVDRSAIENFRTPKLELDSVYGIGPAGSPHLYARDGFDTFLLGACMPGSPQGDPRMTKPLPNDLPRNSHGTALIGDPRNDENLLVAQIHLAFMKFHNKLMTETLPQRHPQMPRDRLFSLARREVTWHYQWIVLHDFLKKIVDPNEVEDVLRNGRKFYCFEEQQAYGQPYIPIEFSVAAYRLGHSMVRQQYNHNRAFADIGFGLLFLFSGKSGAIRGTAAPPLPQPAPSFAALPADWPIDWHRFFHLGKPTQLGLDITEADNKFGFNNARSIDPYLAEELHRLPGAPPGPMASLAFLNLKRGVIMGLPSGQSVAAHMHNPAKGMHYPALTPEEIADPANGPDGPVAEAAGLHRHSPLWYYILKEAQLRGNKGARLGPVGSRILAEVFVGLLQGDDESFLSAEPGWRPTLGEHPGHFGMGDLLRFVGDLDPLNAPGNRDPAPPQT